MNAISKKTARKAAGVHDVPAYPEVLDMAAFVGARTIGRAGAEYGSAVGSFRLEGTPNAYSGGECTPAEQAAWLREATLPGNFDGWRMVVVAATEYVRHTPLAYRSDWFLRQLALDIKAARDRTADVAAAADGPAAPTSAT